MTTSSRPSKPLGNSRSELPILAEAESHNSGPDEHWRVELREGARHVDDLVRLGHLSAAEADGLRPVTDAFQMLVSRYYLNLIDWDNPECPIRLQAIPNAEEARLHPSELLDPIGDKDHSPTPGLVHRYRDRVLFFPTYRCPMFCRYCFRKSTLNGPPIRMREQRLPALEYIRQHSEIEEVILSGGDPLMLSNQRLEEILDDFWSVPHVRKVRLHSRFPVTLPQRINAELVTCLTRRGRVKLVTHFNHPQELTESAFQALTLLRDGGVELANQAVLLRRVNDDAVVLSELFTRLARIGVEPYYLHHLDAAPGTDHFRLSVQAGLKVYREACRLMPMSSPPKYVLDVPGGGGKVRLDGDDVRLLDLQGRYGITSPVDGRLIEWQDPALVTR